MASITQTLAFSVFKTSEFKPKYFVLLLMSYQTMVTPSFIQNKNSAATDFWQNLMIWHGITHMVKFCTTELTTVQNEMSIQVYLLQIICVNPFKMLSYT
jgi:hypothetical protein